MSCTLTPLEAQNLVRAGLGRAFAGFALMWALLVAAPGRAMASEVRPVLPPVIPWKGKSLSLALDPGHRWATPAEQARFERTPRYDETVAYLERLVAAAPELRLVSLGKSPEGRDVWMVIASEERAFTQEALLASGKPTLFAQACIHAGEMDGKDAGLMLLRDMTVRGTKRSLLGRANFLFVPMLSTDGHERFSRFARINQRGPEESGWRTTAQNLNLNRDYAKLDSPELRAVVRALDGWRPDLYLDLHVTDGMDFQYDVTWIFNGPHAWSPAIARWLEQRWAPHTTRGLEEMGHVPGPYLTLREDTDPAKGIVDLTAGIRFSQGYGTARHLPTVIIETHSLKPYAQRVLGTYVVLEASLALIGAEKDTLRRAIREDEARRPGLVPLDWKDSDKQGTIKIKGIDFRISDSPVSGHKRVEWTGRPTDMTLPVQRLDAPGTTAPRPTAYWVPAAATDVIERLALHGIRMERLVKAREADVEMDRFSEVTFDAEPFEGRVRVAAKASPEKRRERFAPGSVRVPTDQPLGTLAVLLLESASPDSFFQNGFFHWALQRTEYAEGYIMEAMAERMLAEEPALRAEFEKALRDDPKFAASPARRLDWFYQRTPYFDERWRLYPVARERDR
jgi:murein tripeptide amidase MpaA